MDKNFSSNISYIKREYDNLYFFSYYSTINNLIFEYNSPSEKEEILSLSSKLGLTLSDYNFGVIPSFSKEFQNQFAEIRFWGPSSFPDESKSLKKDTFNYLSIYRTKIFEFQNQVNKKENYCEYSGCEILSPKITGLYLKFLSDVMISFSNFVCSYSFIDLNNWLQKKNMLRREITSKTILLSSIILKQIAIEIIKLKTNTLNIVLSDKEKEDNLNHLKSACFNYCFKFLTVDKILIYTAPFCNTFLKLSNMLIDSINEKDFNKTTIDNIIKMLSDNL